MLGRKKKEKLYKEDLFLNTQKCIKEFLSKIESNLFEINSTNNIIAINFEDEESAIIKIFALVKEVYLMITSFDEKTKCVTDYLKKLLSTDEIEQTNHRISTRLDIRDKYANMTYKIEYDLDNSHCNLYKRKVLIRKLLQDKDDTILYNHNKLEQLFWQARQSTLKHKEPITDLHV